MVSNGPYLILAYVNRGFELRVVLFLRPIVPTKIREPSLLYITGVERRDGLTLFQKA